MPDVIINNIDLWTSALLTKSTAGRGNGGKVEAYGIKKLRELILELAVRGKLVPQDPNDEPASVLLKKLPGGKKQTLPIISEQEELFEAPSGWVWSRLGAIGETFIGLTYSPKDVGESGIPVLRSSNIQQSQIDLSDLVRVNCAVKPELFVNLGDLLICARNGSKALVGKTAMIRELSEPMTFGAFMAIYKSRVNSFVEVFLNSPIFRRNLDRVDTTTINQITQSNLKATIVPLPPLAEQHRIVAKVDELMTLCDQLEKQQTIGIEAHQILVETLLGTLTSAASPEEFAEGWARIADHFDTLFTTEQSIDQLKQTILQLAVMGKLVAQDPNDEPASVLLGKIAAEKELLVKDGRIKKDKKVPDITSTAKPFEVPNGWVWTDLSDLFALVTDGDHQAPPQSTEGVPFLVISNLNTGRICFDGCKFVPSDYYENLDWVKKPFSGDILYTVTGSFGIPVAVETMEKFCVQRHVAILKATDSTPRKYIALLLGSEFAISYASEIATGIAQKTVPLTGLRRMPIPVAPENEQRRIVAKVDEFMALCDDLKSRLADAQTTQVHLADAIVEQAVV